MDRPGLAGRGRGSGRGAAQAQRPNRLGSGRAVSGGARRHFSSGAHIASSPIARSLASASRHRRENRSPEHSRSRPTAGGSPSPPRVAHGSLWLHSFESGTAQPVAAIAKRALSVLVAGWKVGGVLCRWKAEEDQHGRNPAAGPVRRPGQSRRKLGPGRPDPLHPERRRLAFPGRCRRRDSDAVYGRSTRSGTKAATGGPSGCPTAVTFCSSS